MSGADACFPSITLILLRRKAEPSVAFHLKWHKHHFLQNNTNWGIIKLNLVLALQNLTPKSRMQAKNISNFDAIRRQLKYWSLIFLFLESPRQLSELSFLCCEWEWEAVIIHEDNRRQDMKVLPQIPGSGSVTCRVVTLVWNTQLPFPVCCVFILTCLIFTPILFLGSWLMATKGMPLPPS